MTAAVGEKRGSCSKEQPFLPLSIGLPMAETSYSLGILTCPLPHEQMFWAVPAVLITDGSIDLSGSSDNRAIPHLITVVAPREKSPGWAQRSGMVKYMDTRLCFTAVVEMSVGEAFHELPWHKEPSLPCVYAPHCSELADLLQNSFPDTSESWEGSTNSTVQFLQGCTWEKLLYWRSCSERCSGCHNELWALKVKVWTLSDVQSILKSTPTVPFLFLFTRAPMDPFVAVGLKFEQRCSHFKLR